jgi:hypothetical protein
VLHHVCQMGVVREDAVMAAFMELFALRKALDDQAQRKMTGIQQKLRGMLTGD